MDPRLWHSAPMAPPDDTLALPPARLGRLLPMRYHDVPAGGDLPPFVRAASSVRRWQGRLVVVQDDVNALALVDEATALASPLLLPPGPGGRRQFSPDLGNKAHKLDLEASIVLPDGRFVAFGSGSTGERERLVVLRDDLSPTLRTAAPLYRRLREEASFCGSELNVEGALVAGRRLLLFQRGNGAASAEAPAVNAVGTLELQAFLAWLDEGAPAPRLSEVTRVDLGALRGVPLGFTDATSLPDGRVVVLASAEDSPDTFRDGEVLGTRLGFLGERGQVFLGDILEEDGRPTAHKLEGIEFIGAHGDGALEFLVVVDTDDPDRPSMLGRLQLPAPASRR